MKIYKQDGSVPKIYVSGGWGYGNRGDNAILEGTLQAFRDSLPDATLTISSFSSEEIEANHGLPTTPSMHALLYGSRIGGLWNRLSLRLWEWSRRRFPLSKAMQKMADALKRHDVVLLAGGGYFNDGWRSMRAAQYATIRLAHHAGTPVVLCAQTLGHFTDQSIAGDLRRHLALVHEIAVRDKRSVETARKAGRADGRLSLSADQANLLTPLGELPERKTVIVGLMVQNFRTHFGQHGASPSGRVSAGTYLPTLVRVLMRVASSRCVRYRLIPSTVWDEVTIAKLAALLREAGVEFELVKNPLAAEYIHACQSVDLMISTNMHPIIIAASNYRPSIALSYSFKIDDYMESLGMSDFNFRIDDFEEGVLVGKIEALMSDTRRFSKLVKEHKVNIDALAMRNLEIVRDLFQQAP